VRRGARIPIIIGSISMLLMPQLNHVYGQAGPPSVRVAGSITIDGQNAPVGTVATASVGSVVCGTSVRNGVYNGKIYYVDITSSLSACDTAGNVLTFSVNGAPANESLPIPSILGGGSFLNLTVNSGVAHGGGNGPNQSPPVASTQVPPPLLMMPSDPSVTPLDASDLEIDWTADTEAVSGYELDDGNSGARIATFDAGTYRFVLHGLSPNTEYCVVLYAYNSSSYSPPSNVICSVTPPS
jgi:hypothetical protein